MRTDRLATISIDIFRYSCPGMDFINPSTRKNRDYIIRIMDVDFGDTVLGQ